MEKTSAAHTPEEDWELQLNQVRKLYGSDAVLPAEVSLADAAKGHSLAALLVARSGWCRPRRCMALRLTCFFPCGPL